MYILHDCAAWQAILMEIEKTDECRGGTNGLARKAGHEPQLLDRVFKMQVNPAKNGTMKIANWGI